MFNERLLFEKNSDTVFRKHKIRNMYIEYIFRDTRFDGYAIRDIIKFVNFIQSKYRAIKIPVIFNLGNIIIEDKLAYIIFECICDYLISYCGRDVKVLCKPKRSIWTDGIESSPLLLLNTKKSHTDKFKQKFNRDIYKNHYRRVIHMDDTNKYLLSEIMDDIDYFLKPFDVMEQSRKEVAEVVVELVGNANEHARSDCLLDLDITDLYQKEGDGEFYHGVNLAVINFSDVLLGDGIRHKIESTNTGLNSRHKELLGAYSFHKKFFDDQYCEEDFFNIASFQHKISGRKDNMATGGTGLTKLIHSLENKSDAHKCYVLSGQRVLWFHKEYLEYEDGWIGFNASHDFMNEKPDVDSLSDCPVYIPGTSYNLNFILKREK